MAPNSRRCPLADRWETGRLLTVCRAALVRQTSRRRRSAVETQSDGSLVELVRKQTSFRACDWLLFLFTIITLRRSYDEVVSVTIL